MTQANPSPKPRQNQRIPVSQSLFDRLRREKTGAEDWEQAMERILTGYQGRPMDGDGGHRGRHDERPEHMGSHA